MDRPIHSLCVLAALGLALPAPRGWAQPEPAESPAERGAPPLAPLDDSVRQAADDLTRPAHGGVVYRAADPASSVESTIPGIMLPDLSPEGGVLLPEGAFLPERRGILVPVGDEGWAFVFDADASGGSEPPMLMQPSRRLEEMVRLVEGRVEPVTFVLDAQAYVYRGRNLLLAIRFDTVALDESEAPTTDDEREAAVDANTEILGEGSMTERSLDDLLERLDRAGEPRRRAAVDRSASGEAVAEAGRVTEGAWIMERPGRIGRGARGRWVFVPENDADAGGDAAADAPLFLMPCRNLERLERLIAERGESLRLTISGPVFAYRDRTVVNPTMFVVAPSTGNLTPAR
jgi:hypothetical protein